MKPTVQAPEFYQVGNDYVQAPLSGFFEEEMTCIAPDGSESVCDSYQDGIYRQLSKTLTEGEFSADPWKDPKGFNKRTVLVDPMAPIPTYTSGDSQYSVADVVYGIGPVDDAGSAINPDNTIPANE
jgi:hypothetical protein